jgi:hypothetical protein
LIFLVIGKNRGEAPIKGRIVLGWVAIQFYGAVPLL